MMKPPRENAAQYEINPSDDTPIIEITQRGNWMMLLVALLLGISLAYGGIVIASNNGLKIPGVVRAEVVREVPVTKIITKEVPQIKEVPVEKVIEKPVYIERPIDRPVRVPVPVQPYRISIDAPRNIPGCFPIFIHLFYGSGDSRNYQATICGRWY